MATNLDQEYLIGTHAVYNNSTRYLYATFSNKRYDAANDCMLFNLRIRSEYLHTRYSYTGLYSMTSASVGYDIKNCLTNLNTSRNQNLRSINEYWGCSYNQHTGRNGEVNITVHVGRNIKKKNIRVDAPSPGWSYAFWNHAVGGNIDTPEIDWDMEFNILSSDGTNQKKKGYIISSDGTKTVIPSGGMITKPSHNIRYLVVYSAGSSVDGHSHITELQAWSGGVNVARGKVPVSEYGSNFHHATDGDTSTPNHINIGNRIALDLGQEYPLDSVRIWRYYLDGRIYKETAIYGYDGDFQLCWKICDYKRDGTYAETSEGKTYNI